MPFIVDVNTKDTLSTNACCDYLPLEMTGEYVLSPDVYFQGDQLKYYIQNTSCEDVPCSNPRCNGVSTPLKRTMNVSIDKNIYINGNLFAMQGDYTIGEGAIPVDRLVTGPYKYDTIFFNTKS